MFKTNCYGNGRPTSVRRIAPVSFTRAINNRPYGLQVSSSPLRLEGCPARGGVCDTIANIIRIMHHTPRLLNGFAVFASTPLVLLPVAIATLE